MDLAKHIKDTIVYFDIFDWPLTAWEVSHWLYNFKADMTLVKNELDVLVKQGQLGTKNGFYFLPKRDDIIIIRQHRYLLAELKYQIALRAIKLLRILPFIKFVGVCNTLAYNNAKEESDIDLLIITKANRIWSARFMAAALMRLLKWRPTVETAKNKICLSFFLAENQLNIKDISISDDMYLHYWIAQIVPLYDPADLYKKFQDSNKWVKEYVPNYLLWQTAKVRVINNTFLSLAIKKSLEFVFYFPGMESFLKKLQFAILPTNLKNIVNKDTRVVMNDHILKFHDDDRREYFRDCFNKNKLKYNG